jgi:hypothetical protein
MLRITRDVERWDGRTLTLRAMFADLKPRRIRGSPATGWRVLNVYGDQLRPRLYAADRDALNAEWWRLRRKACADLS